MDLTDKEYLAKGKRGIVHTAVWKGKKVVIKGRNPKSEADTIENEARMLRRVNGKGIGPKYLALTDEGLVREFVDGEEILAWIAHTDARKIRTLLAEVLRQCRALDELGISKREMTRPYKHILIANNRPVQIDFERAHETERPKNVTQACQWLVSARMTDALRPRGVALPRQKLRALAKEYKDSYTLRTFTRILEVVA